jgi:transcription antitermination protein NusB
MVDRNTDGLLVQLRPVLAQVPHLDRRLGRALAFLSLYEADLAHHSPAQILERLSGATMSEAMAAPYSTELIAAATEYANELVHGVLSHRGEIDAVIQERAASWPLAQMSAIDRNVLRIGLYESRYGNAKVPLKAAINEAVELAKLFGSETSAKFVNGVLGRALESS